ncbi:GntR family transcriptional regulator [Arsenicitalea aurantiaca]|uniref:GntR family transcriptional regulator n=1 Tax=Arsenicitalea aurantiaca TaxID=1783274 RepID=A0A433XKK8_9HYPH|nr:GntR family transcriptional regulator [Arsenicitalea aurantiaca]RUT34583.1 GntR family transcriptional regulator [Arsenicitalea aurantiaca]
MRVKRAIVRDLFSRAFNPGTHLTIELLTSRYGVSHMPVREALRQLEGEGVVASHAHKGFRIAEITTRYIRNVYDIRIGIESLLARRAVEQGTDADVEALAALHARFLSDLDAPDRLAATETNVRFHSALYAIAGNPEALHALEGRTLVVRTFGSDLSGYRDADRPLVAAEHQAIMDALIARDPGACSEAVYAHVTAARERLVERMLAQGLAAPA